MSSLRHAVVHCLDDDRDRNEGDGVQCDGVLEGAERQWVMDPQLVTAGATTMWCLLSSELASDPSLPRNHPVTIFLF